MHELGLRGLSVQTEVSLDFDYQGIRLASGYRLDMVVENKVVVEVKALDAQAPIVSFR